MLATCLRVTQHQNSGSEGLTEYLALTPVLFFLKKNFFLNRVKICITCAIAAIFKCTVQ